MGVIFWAGKMPCDIRRQHGNAMAMPWKRHGSAATKTNDPLRNTDFSFEERSQTPDLPSYPFKETISRFWKPVTWRKTHLHTRLNHVIA